MTTLHPTAATFPKAGIITIEGLDGAGKSSAINIVLRVFKEAGINIDVSREPGGTPMAEAIREVHKNPDFSNGGETISPLTESLLMFASRTQLYTNISIPRWQNKGQMTLLDRCWWTTFAYQYFELLPVEQYETLCNMCLSEVSLDAALYLDVDPVTGLERAGKRGALDRIELSGASFFERARRGYLHLANQHADIATIIDSNRPYEQVSADVEAWAKKTAATIKQKYNIAEDN